MQLAKWFGPEAKEPIEYLERDWVSDDWSRGCPAGIFPAGALCQVGHVLRQPCYDGFLHWAGTETATRSMGYMDGAVHAGERAADEAWESLTQEGNKGFLERKKLLGALDKLGAAGPLIDSRRNTRARASGFPWLYCACVLLFVAFLVASFFLFVVVR